MKADPTEKKLTLASGSFAVLKLTFFLIIIPASIPAAGWLVEALIWRHLLCRIDGIDLMGGLLEAFALSAALGAFAACANLLLAVLIDTYKKVKNLPLEKIGQRKIPEINTWADLYKALPGFRPLLQHFMINSVALFTLSLLQPIQLHFDGAFQLFLTAGVLSASWIFCMTALSLIVFVALLRDKKNKAATAGKAIV